MLLNFLVLIQTSIKNEKKKELMSFKSLYKGDINFRQALWLPDMIWFQGSADDYLLNLANEPLLQINNLQTNYW